MVFTDIHDMPRQIAEILDHSAADLAVRPRIHAHPHIHRHAALAGIASLPLAPFVRLFIRRYPFGATLGSVAGMGLYLLDPPAHLVG